MNRYCVLDRGNGICGVGLLLTFSLSLIFDDSFKKVDELYLFLKSIDGKYIVNAEALFVNKIDIVSHDMKAVTYKEATQLYNFLKKSSNDGKIKLKVVGKGVHGDLQFIFKYLINRDSFERFTSYHLIEISSIVEFLKSLNIISEDISGGLIPLCKHFGIETDEKQLHDQNMINLKTFELFLYLRMEVERIKRLWVV